MQLLIQEPRVATEIKLWAIKIKISVVTTIVVREKWQAAWRVYCFCFRLEFMAKSHAVAFVANLFCVGCENERLSSWQICLISLKFVIKPSISFQIFVASVLLQSREASSVEWAFYDAPTRSFSLQVAYNLLFIALRSIWLFWHLLILHRFIDTWRHDNGR